MSETYKSNEKSVLILKIFSFIIFPAIALVMVFFLKYDPMKFSESINLPNFWLFALVAVALNSLYFLYFALKTKVVELSDESIVYQSKNETRKISWAEVKEIREARPMLKASSLINLNLYKIKLNNGSSFLFPPEKGAPSIRYYFTKVEDQTAIGKFLVKKRLELFGK